LQKEVQSLRGQVEDLTHQLQQAQAQPRNTASDLDNRPTKPTNKPILARNDVSQDLAGSNPPEKKIVPAKISDTNTKDKASAANSNQPDIAEEQQIYQTAYNYIKAKKYEDAVEALRSMLKKYPTGQFAANAHYWLGELYSLMSKNDQAATEFGIVVNNFPNAPKASDAQLKLGLLYAAQLKWSDAKGAFKTVMSQYPGTNSARVASDQLRQIKQAGY
jgi:tol-pal system protein YbgF